MESHLTRGEGGDRGVAVGEVAGADRTAKNWCAFRVPEGARGSASAGNRSGFGRGCEGDGGYFDSVGCGGGLRLAVENV